MKNAWLLHEVPQRGKTPDLNIRVFQASCAFAANRARRAAL